MCASFALLMQTRQAGVLITPCKLAPLQVQAAFTVTPSEREGSRVTVYCTITALRHPRFLVAPLLGMTVVERMAHLHQSLRPVRNVAAQMVAGEVRFETISLTHNRSDCSLKACGRTSNNGQGASLPQAESSPSWASCGTSSSRFLVISVMGLLGPIFLRKWAGI